MINLYPQDQILFILLQMKQGDWSRNICDKKWDKVCEMRKALRDQKFQKSRPKFRGLEDDNQISNNTSAEKQVSPIKQSTKIISKPSTVNKRPDLYKRPTEDTQRNTHVYKHDRQQSQKFQMKKMFQISEYMTEVPENLCEYYGTIIQGPKTILMVIDEDKIVRIYNEVGVELKQYSFKIKVGGYEDIIFQGYLVHPVKGLPTYHIKDVLKWGNQDFPKYNFQVRYKEMKKKWQGLADKVAGLNVTLLNYLPICKQNLETIKSQYLNKQYQHGLFFIHKSSQYLQNRVNKQAIIWKNPHKQNHEVRGIGKLMRDGTILTFDGFKIGLTDMQVDKLCYVEFKVDGFYKGQFYGVEALKERKVGENRLDPVSKLIFECEIMGPTIEDMIDKLWY